MYKEVFLSKLESGLSGLPREDISERLTFYGEMIDDRIEDGLSEADAVAEIGSVDSVIEQILADTPLKKLVRERVKPTRSLKAWEIVLIVLSSPVWLSLLIAAVAVVAAVYIVLWSVDLTLWAIDASAAALAVGGVLSGMIFLMQGNTTTSVALIGAGIFFAGLTVFCTYGCIAGTKGIVLLTEKTAIGIKALFVRKGKV